MINPALPFGAKARGGRKEGWAGGGVEEGRWEGGGAGACVYMCLSVCTRVYVNDSWPTRDGLRMAHLNINHAVNKLTVIASVLFISGKNLHILGLSE